MNVTFACPRCERPGRVDLAASAASLDCPNCPTQLDIPAGAIVDGRLCRCLACPSTELFVRKDFPQSLGVAIVAFGVITSSIAWYFRWVNAAFAMLFLSALIDVILYQIVGQALVCYRCNAHYRLLDGLDGHEPFNLETHERFRQEAARLSSQKR